MVQGVNSSAVFLQLEGMILIASSFPPCKKQFPIYPFFLILYHCLCNCHYIKTDFQISNCDFMTNVLVLLYFL